MNPLLATQAELERAYAVSDAYLAIVRRVHAECGPAEWKHRMYTDGPVWECKSCLHQAATRAGINHSPDCLWLAAETLLTKEGEI
jgi:hypothetical protein